ncbi:MAG TPA: hypothetical protein VNK04_23345 [Gemmataceae bacterium]|nr:hypothetical protein [Gemmataceae bacterium]
MPWWWVVPALLLAVAIVAVLIWCPWRARAEVRRLRRACKLFHLQREHLEAQFLPAAAATGKPRGLRWKDCEWESDVVFARDRQTGMLVALVGITVRFEAVEGNDMEDLPAVGNLRNASAVFYYQQGRWRTGGKVVFNLNPDEAVARFKNQYEPVDQP